MEVKRKKDYAKDKGVAPSTITKYIKEGKKINGQIRFLQVDKQLGIEVIVDCPYNDLFFPKQNA